MILSLTREREREGKLIRPDMNLGVGRGVRMLHIHKLQAQGLCKEGGLVLHPSNTETVKFVVNI